MPYAVGVSQDPDAGRAIGEAVGHVLDQLGDSPDLVALFASGNHATNHIDDMVGVVNDTLNPTTFVGCSAAGLIGGSQEIEEGSAITLWAGRLQGSTTVHHLYTPASAVEIDYGDAHTLVLLADPHTFDINAATDHWSQNAPNMKIIGGLVATNQPHVRLIASEQTHTSGAVALLISGETEVVPLVSQGCKPIGQPLTITASKLNIIESLGGKRPIERIYELRNSLSEEDVELVRSGLLVGRVVNEHRAKFNRGDFLIRNIMGIDQQSGAIAIADDAPVGATVQFHVRDSSTAHDDLLALLAQTGPAQGALLFTCNGRGSHMFEKPGHDASAVADITDNGAVAGMFCAGEIGPIGGKTTLHGFTASVALFRDRNTV